MSKVNIDTSPAALRALADSAANVGNIDQMRGALRAVADEKVEYGLSYVSLFGQTQEALERIKELEREVEDLKYELLDKREE